MRWMLPSIALSLVLSACASTGEVSEEPIEQAQPAVAVAIGPRAVDRPVPSPAIADYKGPAVVFSSNLTIVVDDFGEAVTRVRRIVSEAGGQISHSSVQPQNATVQAMVAPKTLEAVRIAITRIGEVQNENGSRNDLRPNIEQASERIRRIAQGQAAVQRALAHAANHEESSGLMVLSELGTRERDNLENQIRSYRQQAHSSQIYVTFTRKSG